MYYVQQGWLLAVQKYTDHAPPTETYKFISHLPYLGCIFPYLLLGRGICLRKYGSLFQKPLVKLHGLEA